MEQKFSKKCFNCESNTGPSDLQSDALPTELLKQLGFLGKQVFIKSFIMVYIDKLWVGGRFCMMILTADGDDRPAALSL